MTGAWADTLPDLLRALSVLQLDDAGKAIVARLLGVGAAVPATKLAEKKDDRPEVETDQQLDRPGQPLPSTPIPAQSPEPETEIPSVLVPAYTENRRAPDWLEMVDPLPEVDSSVVAPLSEPLLVPQWARGILGASVATLSEVGPLDVERLVRGIARGLPWHRVPRSPWPTLARGAMVLVDRSETLLPYAADQEWLVARIRAVVGHDALRVLDFEGCPSWGAGTGSQWEWEEDCDRWRPSAGTPVLALTDLGIGTRGYGTRPVHPTEWQAFADHLRRAGCPLVAFVPYARDRWPAGLDRAMHIFLWDRETSVRTVRRVLGKALRVPGWDRR